MSNIDSKGGVRMKYRFLNKGYCPVQQDYETIEIDTVEIRMAGRATPGYKKVSFFCDYANSCSCDISNECPVFLEAPSNPF